MADTVTASTSGRTTGEASARTVGVSWRHSRLAPVLVLACIYPLRFWGNFGPISTFSLLDVTVWASLVLLLVHPSGRIVTGPGWLAGALALPAIASVVSLAWSQDQVSTFKAAAYHATGFAAYLVALNACAGMSRRRIERSWAVFVIASVAIAVLYWARVPIVWQLLGASLEELAELDEWMVAAVFSRLNSPLLGRSNDFAAILAPFLFLFVGAALVRRDRLVGVTVAVASLGITFTLSRGIGAAVVLLLLVGLMRQASARGWLIFGAVVVVVLLATGWFVASIEQSGFDILESRRDSVNIESRLERWAYAVEVVRAFPLTGLGAGRHMPYDVVDVRSAVHNTYLEQMAAFGVPLGGLLVVALLGIPFWLTAPSRAPAAVVLRRWARLGAASFLLGCATQTQNEAAMPSLLFRIYLGVAVAYLWSSADAVTRPRDGAR